MFFHGWISVEGCFSDGKSLVLSSSTESPHLPYLGFSTELCRSRSPPGPFFEGKTLELWIPSWLYNQYIQMKLKDTQWLKYCETCMFIFISSSSHIMCIISYHCIVKYHDCHRFAMNRLVTCNVDMFTVYTTIWLIDLTLPLWGSMSTKTTAPPRHWHDSLHLLQRYGWCSLVQGLFAPNSFG